MPIKRLKKVRNYTMVHNAVAEDHRLSFKAKGIMLVLLSKPDNWIIKLDNIASHSSDGQKSTRSGFRELITYGYLTREQTRDPQGQLGEVIYTAHEQPSSTQPPSPQSPNRPAVIPTHTHRVDPSILPPTDLPLAANRHAACAPLIINKNNKTQTAAMTACEPTQPLNTTSVVALESRHTFITKTLTSQQVALLHRKLDESTHLWPDHTRDTIAQIIIQELENPSVFTQAGCDYHKKLNTLFKAWRKHTWSPHTTTTVIKKQQATANTINDLQAQLRTQHQERHWLIQRLSDDTLEPSIKQSYQKSLQPIENAIAQLNNQLQTIQQVTHPHKEKYHARTNSKTQ